MRVLYKPFAIIAAILGARLGRRTFRSVWTRLDPGEPPPTATTEEASLTKVVGAAALEAATIAGIEAAVDRMSVRTFHYLTGIWPAKKPQPPAES
jgi:uncharacterized protein DUF4235